MTAVRRLSLLDLGLLVGAVAGFAAYLWLMPAQHPDAAADFRLGEEQAAARAAAVLAQNGFVPPADLSQRVAYRRNPDLLLSLQQALGRPEATRFLESRRGDALPAYYWRVAWSPERRGDPDGGPGGGPGYEVELNAHGELLGLRTPPRAAEGVNRAAVAALLAGGAAEPRRGLAASDSALAGALQFSERLPGWGGRAAAPAPGVAAALERLAAGAPEEVLLGPAEAVVYARRHLRGGALARLPLQVDSVWVAASGAARTRARVRFRGAPEAAHTPLVEVEVSAVGALHYLGAQFRKPDAPKQASGALSFSFGGSERDEDAVVSATGEGVVTADAVVGGIRTLLIAAVAVALLILFFRILHARAVDWSACMRDAVVGGLALGAMVALVAGPDIVAMSPNLWSSIGIVAITVLLSGAGGAVAILGVSAVSDSLAREVWPEKLAPLALMRHGVLRNAPVGQALLRGLAVSGVLLGLWAALLALAPGLYFSFHGQTEFWHSRTYSPVGVAFSSAVWMALLTGFALVQGQLSLYRRVFRRPAWAAALAFAVLTLSGAVPLPSMEPELPGLLVAAAGAAVLTAVYLRTNLLVCIVGGLFAEVFATLTPGWAASGAPEAVDVMIAGGVFLAVGGIGLAGVLSRREAGALPEFTPSYVLELARDERLKRELELARQVQATFLPQKMPRVEGLDIAAVCHAAEEVGGDYYDFMHVGPGKLALVVGDVSGKGIPAAFYMTLTKGFLQTLCRMTLSPADVLRQLNELFCQNAPRGMFISLIFGVIDTEARTFTFARAGHNPVILKRSPSRRAEFMLPEGMAIGLVSGPRFDDAMREETVRLLPGDVLVLYTDGFSEAMNAARELYTDERLGQAVSAFGGGAAAEILHAVNEDVDQFVQNAGQHDDMTMVVVKITGRASPAPTDGAAAVREPHNAYVPALS